MVFAQTTLRIAVLRILGACAQSISLPPFPVITGMSTLPVSHYSFTPFPTPTQSAVPGLFPSMDPKSPPSVQSDPKIVPDFATAWAVAYKKARSKV